MADCHLQSRTIVNLGLGFAGYWDLVDYGSDIDDFALFCESPPVERKKAKRVWYLTLSSVLHGNLPRTIQHPPGLGTAGGIQSFQAQAGGASNHVSSVAHCCRHIVNAKPAKE